MTLSVKPKPYMIPEYSLTGDLLAYLTCGLQYRYYNKAALPPSTPVQLWFGEFIHGVMEEAYQVWRANAAQQQFPWTWAPTVRDIEVRVHERLTARGLYPPPQLFCPYPAPTNSPGLCADAQHPHQLLASHRTWQAINTWGRFLFPLISEAEVTLKGSRDMPNYQANLSRSNYYSVTGVVDVIGSVQLQNAPAGNAILDLLRTNQEVAASIAAIAAGGYEIIIDYKGMRRPSINSQPWLHHEWQVMTYAWLRANRQQTQPVVAGILLYLNELYPSQEDTYALQDELQNNGTDVMPQGADRAALQGWRRRTAPPALSQALREARSIRVIPVDPGNIANSLQQFDAVVAAIESAVQSESGGRGIRACWQTNPEQRTCTACDFKTYCPNPAPSAYVPTVP